MRKRGLKITTRGVSEGQRWQPRIHPRSHSTPFVPQGRATRRLRRSHKGYVHSRRYPSLTPRVVMGGRFASSPLKPSPGNVG